MLHGPRREDDDGYWRCRAGEVGAAVAATAGVRGDAGRGPGVAVRAAVVDVDGGGAVAGAGGGRRHGGVRRRVCRVPGPDVCGTRPPAAGRGGPCRRHAPRPGLDPVRLGVARQRGPARAGRGGRRGPDPVPGRGRGCGGRLGRPGGLGVRRGDARAPGPAGGRHRRPARRGSRRGPGGAVDGHALRADRPGPLVVAHHRGGQRPGRRHRLPHRRHRRRHGRTAPGAGRAAGRRPGRAGPCVRDG